MVGWLQSTTSVIHPRCCHTQGLMPPIEEQLDNVSPCAQGLAAGTRRRDGRMAASNARTPVTAAGTGTGGLDCWQRSSTREKEGERERN
jgi:hypothetical protein